jgi:protein phosphatase 1L
LFVLKSLKSGTTCCLAIVSGVETSEQIQRSIDVAWCGDTQFCLVKNGQINFITEEHKPNNPSEKKRIEDTGGTVSYVSEAWRVNGSLAVSRSFGTTN